MTRSVVTVDRHRAEWEPLGDVLVGGRPFRNPISLASGTAGHADELAAYVPMSSLGAVVVKSLFHTRWDGNPAPRVRGAGAGMLNAVGLQGPGVQPWITHDLPRLLAVGANVVASIWGRSVDDYATAAELLTPVAANLAAVEVNLSCPNLEGRSAIFAHDEQMSSDVISAVVAAMKNSETPVWAKLSANTDRIVNIAGAVHESGAAAVTLVNTLLGMHIDLTKRRPSLGAGGGGLSGPAIHPVAVRAIFDVRQAHPHLDIVGVGGVAHGQDVIEMMMAGASMVQVGTATFADPRASHRILLAAAARARRLGATSWRTLINSAH